MAETKFSREIMTEFIEVYKQHPCLWKVKSKEYYNKSMKNAAYEQLINVAQRQCPNADKDFVMRKINTIRGCFRKELNKIKKSKIKETDPYDVYQTSLWYFPLLQFTLDQEVPKQSVGSIEDEIIDTRTTVKTVYDVQYGIQEFTQLSPAPSTSVSEKEDKRSRRHDSEKNDEVIKKIYKILSEKEDEFDAIGVAIAAKLRKIDQNSPEQRVICERLMNELLYKATFKELTRKTKIVTEDGTSSRSSFHCPWKQ